MKNYKLKIIKGVFAALFSFCIFNFAFSQSILTADGLAVFGTNAPAVGGGGGTWPADSRVADWKFNGDLTDASGGGNTLTMQSGTASFTVDESGVANHALIFNGATPTRAEVASTSLANFTSGNFSVVMYLTNTAANFNASPVIFSKGTVGGTGYHFQLHLAAGGDNLAAHAIMGFHTAGGVQKITTTADRAIPLVGQLCLVFTRNGTVGKIYLNGTDITDAASQSLLDPVSDTTDKFRIGDYSGTGFPFTGNMQEMLLFSRTLTSGEVATGSATPSQ